MAARRPSVCLFCQARQSSIGRRKATSSARRRMEAAVAQVPEGEMLLRRGQRQAESMNSEAPPLSRPEAGFKRRRRETGETGASPLDFESLLKSRDARLDVLRKLSNPWPQWNENNQPIHPHGLQRHELQRHELPEANAAPLPHAVFRRKVREAEGYKAIRHILRAQLLRCEVPKDVMRILAFAMQSKEIARNLAALGEPITRAMYRCRNNVSDPEILRTLKIIVNRFRLAELDFEPHLLFVALKFAARARSLPAMKMFLRLIRERGKGMSNNVFRTVIAKFSIGHRGLGEIRNGRWRREQLLQVLKGFDDCAHLPPEQQYHLGSFMLRDDWQYLHGWVAVLARCRDADAVWEEWRLWRSCPAREVPRRLNGQASGMTTKLRGDFWFVEQMTYTGDLGRAWKLLAETGLNFSTLKTRVKSRLLEGAEYATVWDEELREAMIWKYDLELSKIEHALGVVWTPSPSSPDEAEGMHTLIPGQTQEESLECLATRDFGREDHFGFPYDGDGEREGETIVEDGERSLHDAEEEGSREREWIHAGRGTGAMNERELESARRGSLQRRTYVP